MKDVIICPCIDTVLLGWMSLAIGVKQKQKIQLWLSLKKTKFLNVLPLHSRR